MRKTGKGCEVEAAVPGHGHLLPSHPDRPATLPEEFIPLQSGQRVPVTSSIQPPTQATGKVGIACRTVPCKGQSSPNSCAAAIG